MPVWRNFQPKAYENIRLASLMTLHAHNLFLRRGMAGNHPINSARSTRSPARSPAPEVYGGLPFSSLL
jgi:hypothetical protein